MRPREQYEEVDRLIRWGYNDCQVARLTGIPRGTVREWRVKGQPGVAWHARRDHHLLEGLGCAARSNAEAERRAYAYLAGLYLGDGCISPNRSSFRLRVALDRRYPEIIRQCADAMRHVRGDVDRHIAFIDGNGCVEVVSCWAHWPCLFPQHGPGRKHERLIRLEPWQGAIVRRHPEHLLRGLIHSDGCRVINRVAGHDYPRYFFTNHSEDIRAIFCRACEDFGVAWRQSRWNTISVARREAVARLDAVIGAKT